jgi:nitric oxide reductase NorQ protein
MTAPAIPAPARGRLGNGQLRRQVAEWLAARPGPHTVGEIAKDLGRSAGAVGNALTTLADRAEASRIAGKPLRYEANSATAAAAAGITPKAPAPPKAAPPKAAPAAPPAAPKPAAPPASPKAPAPKAKPGPVTRPGGQVYRPRVLAGMADVEALRTLRAEGVPALLSGPPGTGKTSLVEAAFPDLITVAGVIFSFPVSRLSDLVFRVADSVRDTKLSGFRWSFRGLDRYPIASVRTAGGRVRGRAGA